MARQAIKEDELVMVYHGECMVDYDDAGDSVSATAVWIDDGNTAERRLCHDAYVVCAHSQLAVHGCMPE